MLVTYCVWLEAIPWGKLLQGIWLWNRHRERVQAFLSWVDSGANLHLFLIIAFECESDQCTIPADGSQFWGRKWWAIPSHEFLISPSQSSQSFSSMGAWIHVKNFRPFPTQLAYVASSFSRKMLRTPIGCVSKSWLLKFDVSVHIQDSCGNCVKFPHLETATPIVWTRH